MPDETVRVKFLIDTQDAIAKTAQVQAQVAAIKAQVQDVAAATGAAFREVANVMKRQAWSELKDQFQVQKVNPITQKVTIDKAALDQAKAAYFNYIEALKKALAELEGNEKSVAKWERDRAKQRQKEEADAAKAVAKSAQEAAKAQQEADAARDKAIDKMAAAQQKQLNDELKLRRAVAAEIAKLGNVQPTSVVATAQQSQVEIEKLKASIMSLSEQSGISFDKIADAMKRAYANNVMANVKTPEGFANAKAQIANFNKTLSSALKEVQVDFKNSQKAATNLDGELKQKPKDAGAVSTAFSKLGDISKFVFGTVLGISAIQILRDIAQWFGNALKSGEEFAQSIFKLTASVHALQRVGFDITMKDTLEILDKLGKRYAMFSQKELVDGVAQVQLLTRSFGFSKEQMQQTFEVAATLSSVLGKDFNEAARETALFLSSGYAESMQKAGLAVNRLTVQQEAHRKGIEKSYMTMTEQERSMAALSLVYREIGPLMKEVDDYQKSEIGQLKIAATQYENVKNAIGMKLIPVKLALVKGLISAYNALYSLNGIMIIIKDTIFSSLISPIILATNVWKEFTNGTYDFGNAIKTTIQQATEMRNKMVQADIGKMGAGLDFKDLIKGTDLPKGEWGSMPLLTPDQSEEQQKIIEDMVKNASKLIRDYQRDFEKAGRDLTMDMGTIDTSQLDNILGAWDSFFSDQNNMTVDATEAQQTQWEQFFGQFGSIVNDGLDKAFGIWQDYYNKLDDIARKEQQSIADENTEYAQKIQDANREAAQATQDATRKYHDEEIKAEREFQEKMRRLKEQYLFDLEDALRERDALQVLRLMRKYQMDKANAQRDYELDAQARKEAFQKELEDIRIQRERKLQELAIEHQRRLQEIRLQADREREEAARNRDQAMEQLKADLEKERTERQIKYQQELEDLKTRFGERLTEIMAGLADEEGMTKEKLDAIGQLYLDMFGKQGVVDMSYEQLKAMTQAAVQTAQNALAQIQQMSDAAAQTAANIAAQVAAAQANMATMGVMQQVNYGVGAPPSSAPTGPRPNANPTGNITGRAFGGTDYANTPTLRMFGEAGPEIATFTPVSRFNTKNLGLPNAYLGDTLPGASSGGKTQVIIRLSPGLVSEIVDGAMNGVARIIEEQ